MVNLEYEKTQSDYISSFYFFSSVVLLLLISLIFNTDKQKLKTKMTLVSISIIISVCLLIFTMTKYAKDNKTEKDKDIFFTYNTIIKILTFFTTIIIFSYCFTGNTSEKAQTILLGNIGLKILGIFSIIQFILAILLLNVGFLD